MKMVTPNDKNDAGEKCQDNYVEREQKGGDYQERVENSQQDPSEELPF